jgi:prolyl-tRNA editing enzyme YbaK/EbsC (Cys-tRNA(Pro) deacylase)
MNPSLDHVRHTLTATGADFHFIDCDPALSDTALFCEHYGYALADSVNTILMKARNGTLPYVACALLGHTRLDANHTLRKRLQARKVSFASADETRAITGMELGGVTAFGLPEGLPLWVDDAVMQRATLIFGSGERASKIVTTPAALAALPGVEVVEGLAKTVD